MTSTRLVDADGEASERRCHEVRIGMALYFVHTWPDEGGHAYEGFNGLAGRTAGTRQDALRDARVVLARTNGGDR